VDEIDLESYHVSLRSLSYSRLAPGVLLSADGSMRPLALGGYLDESEFDREWVVRIPRSGRASIDQICYENLELRPRNPQAPLIELRALLRDGSAPRERLLASLRSDASAELPEQLRFRLERVPLIFKRGLDGTETPLARLRKDGWRLLEREGSMIGELIGVSALVVGPADFLDGAYRRAARGWAQVRPGSLSRPSALAEPCRRLLSLAAC